MISQSPQRLSLGLSTILSLVLGMGAYAEPVTLTVHADQPGVKMDPIFYGLMTEEINYSYDGGLYAELIQNRTFQDTPPPARGGRGGRGRGATQPAADAAPEPAAPAPAANYLQHWSVVASDGAAGTIEVDPGAAVNAAALKQSLKLAITTAGTGKRVGVANDGYWGIPVKPNTEYKASFYARPGNGFNGPLTVTIESNDGKTTYATGTVPTIGSEWKKYSLTLKTSNVPPTAEARFVISGSQPGTVWLNLVSLFPPTYKNRSNGNRVDISQLLADMKPKFLRFPGGNYLEGSNFENRFDWKKTIGPLEDRPGHWSPWRYRSSDGTGLLEFLGWCEDLGMEPILGVYAGMHLDQGRTTITGDALKPYVEEALEEIEYITGDVNTKWGARRAQDGHPAPFKMQYVEIGNEDWLNNGLQNYAGRYAMFHDAIKTKYPNIKVMSSLRSRDRYDHTRTPDLFDDHFYVNIPTALSQAHYYDNYDRNSPTKIFVGEWATNSPRGGPTGHMAFALGDAAWLTGLERNADVVTINCYAPLFCNVNPGGMQWSINLIGYDALGSFGSPAYYVQQMFSSNRGDVALPVKIDPLPMLTAEQIPQAPAPAAGGRAGGGNGGGGARGPVSFDGVYAVANRDSASGDLILKIVNVQSTPQPATIDVQGAARIIPQASGSVLTAPLDAQNSVAEPKKVSPQPITITNAGTKFAHELPAHSVSVIRLKTR